MRVSDCSRQVTCVSSHRSDARVNENWTEDSKSVNVEPVRVAASGLEFDRKAAADFALVLVGGDIEDADRTLQIELMPDDVYLNWTVTPVANCQQDRLLFAMMTDFLVAMSNCLPVGRVLFAWVGRCGEQQ